MIQAVVLLVIIVLQLYLYSCYMAIVKADKLSWTLFVIIVMLRLNVNYTIL